MAIYKALAFASTGSILEIGARPGVRGRYSCMDSTSFEAVPGDLVVSGLIAAGVGSVIMALALYIPARRSVSHEVTQERREMHVEQVPEWRRLRLDLALLATAGVAEVIAVRTCALDPLPGSVYSGLAITLPSRLVVAPLFAWVGGLLLSL